MTRKKNRPYYTRKRRDTLLRRWSFFWFLDATLDPLGNIADMLFYDIIGEAWHPVIILFFIPTVYILWCIRSIFIAHSAEEKSKWVERICYAYLVIFCNTLVLAALIPSPQAAVASLISGSLSTIIFGMIGTTHCLKIIQRTRPTSS